MKTGRQIHIQRDELKAYLLAHDEVTVPEAAKVFNCAPKYLQRIANEVGLSRRLVGKWVLKQE